MKNKKTITFDTQDINAWLECLEDIAEQISIFRNEIEDNHCDIEITEEQSLAFDSLHYLIEEIYENIECDDEL